MNSDLVADEPWDLRIEGSSDQLLSLEHAGEPSTDELAGELAERGLSLRARTFSDDRAIARAGGQIHRVPALERVVLSRVQDILILDSPDPCIDVSHSEPRWPTRIFVSMPPGEPIGDLRLAEAVVHEAMHLNLTLLEGQVQLVIPGYQLYSPWRRASRPAGGVLHGLYVFVCLLRFFEILKCDHDLSAEQHDHLARRQAQILTECGEIQPEALSMALTSDARLLVTRLFKMVDDCRI